MHGRKIRTGIAVVFMCIPIACSRPEKNPLPAVEKIDHRNIIDMVQKDHHKATLVNVWATWCEPCRDEMPGLIRLRQKYSDSDLSVILVSADDIDKADSLVPRTLDTLGVDFQTYIDDDSTDEAFISGMNPAWSGALPASFLYDREGNLVDMMVGGKSYETFEKAILKILK
jgi:thiol-disulfide isomerase/thioredoxin